MPTREDLKYYQSLPLELKIAKTKDNIREFVREFGVDDVYVSFSGGKDSTVLLDIAREMYPEIEAVFVNTGLEYPEIQKFVKTFDNVRIVYPKHTFREVISEWGYPIISKDISRKIHYARKGNKWALKYINGTAKKNGKKSRYCIEKYKPLLNVDFKISDACCRIMKKSPAHSIKKMPIIATMTEESLLRKQSWLLKGCNSLTAILQASRCHFGNSRTY